MHAISYRIKDPTLAVVEKSGSKVMITVPAGAIVTAENYTVDAMEMVEVVWDKRHILMFALDLRTRGEAVNYQAA